MTVIKAQVVEMNRLRRTVSFPFDKESGLIAPPELREIGIGEEVSLTVTGKVVGFSADEEGECLRLEVKKVEMAGAEPPRRTLGKMLREIKRQARAEAEE